MTNENNGELEQVRVPLRTNVGDRFYQNRRQAANLDSLRYQGGIYPSLNAITGPTAPTAPSAPEPSAPPPLPMPTSPSRIYPMQMEESNMGHKNLPESFVNDFNNLETESIISEPPSYNGAVSGYSTRAPAKPERKKKGVSIVINNQ